MEKLDVKLVLPKELIEIPQDARVYYLAGPIRGADDWQATAISMLARLYPGCYVACPCRYDDNHPLSQYSAQKTYPSSYSRQTLWERRYMLLAAEQGCLIFWLPCESKINPRPKDQGPYAQDTYGELGRWSTLISTHNNFIAHNNFYKTPKARNPLKMIVGAEDDFPGLSTIRTNLTADFGYDYPIYTDLYQTLSCGLLDI